MSVADIVARRRVTPPEFLAASSVVPTGKDDLDTAALMARGLALTAPAPIGIGFAFVQYINGTLDDLLVTQVCIAAYREDGIGVGLAASSYSVSNNRLTTVPLFRPRPSCAGFAAYMLGRQSQDVLAERAVELALMDYETTRAPMPPGRDE